jgi:hypothetical protein
VGDPFPGIRCPTTLDMWQKILAFSNISARASTAELKSKGKLGSHCLTWTAFPIYVDSGVSTHNYLYDPTNHLIIDPPPPSPLFKDLTKESPIQMVICLLEV